MAESLIRHFVLTRFNLLIFNKDKEGNKVRSKMWLDHRFDLFERYCLSSLKGQTCKEFTWIVLFDSTTPEKYKKKVENYQKVCPQLIPVYVSPEGGRYFVQIFRDEVVKRLNGNRVITTYLDNDDALDIHFVEDIQRRAATTSDGTFFFYTEGYQYFTDHQYLMKIHYPRNHFASVIEDGNPTTLKTIYGYGSHYYIDKIPDVKIEYVKNLPMWCQVVHQKNMGNDAYFLNVRMVKDKSLLASAFCVNENVKYGLGIYLFRFLPRYAKTFIRRCKIKLRGYRFE